VGRPTAANVSHRLSPAYPSLSIGLPPNRHERLDSRAQRVGRYQSRSIVARRAKWFPPRKADSSVRLLQMEGQGWEVDGAPVLGPAPLLRSRLLPYSPHRRRV